MSATVLGCVSASLLCSLICVFFFNDTATTEIYTLSLHDALPIYTMPDGIVIAWNTRRWCALTRSEEHTSELQSPCNLVCRLLLEKKKHKNTRSNIHGPTASGPARPTQRVCT